MMKILTSFFLLYFLIQTLCTGQDVNIDIPIVINEIDTTSVGGIVTLGVGNQLMLKKFKVGDIAHGGIVFYVDESGIHGLVAGEQDLSNGATWQNQSPIKINARSQEVGAGLINTVLIAIAQNSEDVDSDFAARICLNIDHNGFGDWYLPSSVELGMIYQNLALKDLGNFPEPFLSYWSSSEVDKNHAYYINFSNGMLISGLKDTFLGVRPVRTF